MRLPLVPFGVSNISGLVQWLRTLAVSIAAGWSVEHTSTGTHLFPSGEWTPTLTFGNTAAGMTYSVRVGRYVKTGKVVHAQAHITLTAKGSATGTAVLSGFPFVALAGDGVFQAIHAAYYVNLSGLNNNLCGLVSPSSASVVLVTNGAASVSVLTEANFTDTSQLILSATYLSNA